MGLNNVHFFLSMFPRQIVNLWMTWDRSKHVVINIIYMGLYRVLILYDNYRLLLKATNAPRVGAVGLVD